ncbi:GGDEF domain-containing protein [Vibrio sp. MA40-2]|uniref:GGDEF domain-containing protein n=1 Tax=Vibrio sp. MA40-2 TaxID=3391828 RepID=UPI0039A67B7A
MKEPLSPWLQKAKLPLNMVGALSALILALNFLLDLLSLLNMQWEHQLLLVILLICLAGWTLVEMIMLRLQERPSEPFLNSLQRLLMVQLLVQLVRLGLFLMGSSAKVDQTYGIWVVSFNMVFILLPVYLLVFLLIGRTLVLSYTSEIESAYRKLRKSSRTLTKLATTDPLTKAFNRRHFEESTTIEIPRAQRHATSLSLIIFDIDHFKNINDSFGHSAGDKVLINLTQLTLQNLRSSDILARWGGEEFIILLPQCNAEEAKLIAEKLRLSIAEYDFDQVGHITCSFGVAQMLPDERLDSWVHRADQALYQVKNNGRNATSIATERDQGHTLNTEIN